MATFNPKSIADYAKHVKNIAKGGDTRVFAQKDLQEGVPVDIRLLKPRPNQGGEWKFFVEVQTYWINSKPYQTGTFLGGADVIAEEIEEAQTLGDPTIDELLSSENFRPKIEFFMPIRLVEVVQNETTGEVESIKVNPKKDIFSCTASVLDQINDILCNPRYVAGRNGNGIFDPLKGNSLTVSKTGVKMNTKYKVMLADQFELPEVWANPEKTPDVIAYLKKSTKSDEYLRAAIRNYLYGEDMPDKDHWKVDSENEATTEPEQKPKQTPTNAVPALKKAVPPVSVAEVKPKTLADSLAVLEDDDDEEEGENHDNGDDIPF